MIKPGIFLSILIVLSCIGCSSGQAFQESTEIKPILTSTPTFLPSSTPIPPTPTSKPTSTLELVGQICSPLQNETLASLPQIITQPFKMPPLGFDYDHQGVDFSFYRRNGRIGIHGLPVYSVLDGKVIAVLKQKMVYGNAIIIETRLNQLPQNWVSKLQLPEISPTVTPNPRLTCPLINKDPNAQLDVTQRSLYLLYAHLDQSPTLRIGDQVSCGQQIGAVGNSGKSTNPHLHFEVRIGPSGAVFEGMAHYDSSASEMEMHNYCVWRVSNLFQLIDPMNLLNLK